MYIWIKVNKQPNQYSEFSLPFPRAALLIIIHINQIIQIKH